MCSARRWLLPRRLGEFTLRGYLRLGVGANAYHGGGRTAGRGVVFTAPKGTWLQVRVADPEHVLPQAVSAKGPAQLEPELQVMLKGPDGLYRHPRFLSSGQRRAELPHGDSVEDPDGP